MSIVFIKVVGTSFARRSCLGAKLFEAYPLKFPALKLTRQSLKLVSYIPWLA